MNFKKWFLKLAGAVIQGASHSGTAYLSINAAEALGVKVHLNLEELGIILATSSLIKLFGFLETNPLPEDDSTPPKP